LIIIQQYTPRYENILQDMRTYFKRS